MILWYILVWNLQPILTWMCGSRFDLDGRAAPAVLLHLRHPLAGHLVGFICGTHCNLVLDDALTFQLLATVTAKQNHGVIKPRGSLLGVRTQSAHKITQRSSTDSVQHKVALWRPGLGLLCVMSQATYSPADCYMWGSEISWFEAGWSLRKTRGISSAPVSALAKQGWCWTEEKCVNTLTCHAFMRQMNQGFPLVPDCIFSVREHSFLFQTFPTHSHTWSKIISPLYPLGMKTSVWRQSEQDLLLTLLCHS